MQHDSLLERTSLVQTIDPVAAGASTATNGAAVDMQGWDGVVFVAMVGNTDRTVDQKVQSDDNSGFSSPTDITGAASTQVSATGDSKSYAIDVWRPGERFVRHIVTSGAGGTATLIAGFAIRYRATGRLPISQHATVGELIKKIAN